MPERGGDTIVISLMNTKTAGERRTHAELRDQVIKIASLEFHRHGMRSVTMDSIAKHLSMSKRTLYLLFGDKEALLLACTMKRHEEDLERNERLLSTSHNVLEFVLGVFAAHMREISTLSPEFFADLPLFPKVEAYMRACQEEDEDSAIALLEKGKAEGVFLREANFNIVFRQLTFLLEHTLCRQRLSGYSVRDLFTYTVIPYIRGCATLLGIEIIDRFITDLLARGDLDNELSTHAAPEEDKEG